MYVSASYLFTASLKALPAENFGSFFAAILIVAPVWGFLPVRAFLFESENVPNPTRAALSPFLTALVIASIAPSSALPAQRLEGEVSADRVYGLTLIL